MIRSYLLRRSLIRIPAETPVLHNLNLRSNCIIRLVWLEFSRPSMKWMKGYYTHASPTKYNAGTKRPQMASCFLMEVDDDLSSMMYTGIGDLAMISSSNGGLESVWIISDILILLGLEIPLELYLCSSLRQGHWLRQSISKTSMEQLLDSQCLAYWCHGVRSGSFYLYPSGSQIDWSYSLYLDAWSSLKEFVLVKSGLYSVPIRLRV